MIKGTNNQGNQVAFRHALPNLVLILFLSTICSAEIIGWQDMAAPRVNYGENEITVYDDYQYQYQTTVSWQETTYTTITSIAYSYQPMPIVPSEWTVIDEGTTEVPSQWTIGNPIIQSSNIWDGNNTLTNIPRLGTYLWNYSRNIHSFQFTSGDDDGIGYIIPTTGGWFRESWNLQRKQHQKVFIDTSGIYTLLDQDDVNYVKNQPFAVTLPDTTAGLYCWGNINSRFHDFTSLEPYEVYSVDTYSYTMESTETRRLYPTKREWHLQGINGTVFPDAWNSNMFHTSQFFDVPAGDFETWYVSFDDQNNVIYSSPKKKLKFRYKWIQEDAE